MAELKVKTSNSSLAALSFDEEFPDDNNPQCILESMVWTMVYLTTEKKIGSGTCFMIITSKEY